MVKGTLSNGFEFEVDDSFGDDYEILEMISEVEDNPAAATKLVKAILGTTQTKALKDHLRNDNGKVTVTAMTEAITELFKLVPALKNS